MDVQRPTTPFALLATLFVLGAIASQVDGQTVSQGDEGGAGREIQEPALHETRPPQLSPPQPGQLRAKNAPGAPSAIGQEKEKRIMGVLPNYRTAEMSAESIPLTAQQKLRIAVKDSFDYPLMVIATVYAGVYQWDNSHPAFGQGAKGYFSRLGTSYTDQLDGNMLSEGVLPILLHEDPRYFRLSRGSVKRRAWYSVSRIVVTRTDSNHATFNASEIFGNGIAAAVGLTYYPDDRDPASFAQNWGTQLATDAGSQLLKEFWPDIRRKWSAHRQRVRQAAGLP